MTIKQVIKELLEVEALAEILRKKACTARAHLEQLSAPASKRAPKAGALSLEQKMIFKSKFRQSLIKKSA